MLPWRRHDLRMLPFTTSADELLEVTEAALKATPDRSARRHRRVQRDRRGLAAARSSPSSPTPTAPSCSSTPPSSRRTARSTWPTTQIDHLALSGHKLYAPFGAGALVSRTPLHGDPLLHGGGAIKLVTLDDVVWAEAPDRFEAGSPNVIGAVAFAAACEALQAIGMDTIADRERALSARLHARLDAVPGLTRLALWPVHDERVGVASFTLAGHKAEALAARLSDDYAIAVRHGCFCAHPLITRLLHVPEAEAQRLHAELRRGREPELPGAVRASIGLGTTTRTSTRSPARSTEISRRR